MEFLKKIVKNPLMAFKILGLTLLGLFVIFFAVQLLRAPLETMLQKVGVSTRNSSMGYDRDDMMDGVYEESASYGGANAVSRDMLIGIPEPVPPQDPGYSTGDTAEDFEITEYSANIETTTLEETCTIVANLKVRDDVIFENANSYDRGCNYSFKVKNDSAAQVLEIIESLDPKNLSENTYTIQQQIKYYTSEVEILEKKRDSILETLENAENAYDEITKLATNVKDVESLANIINSKLQLLERLTEQHIAVTEQLNRLEQSKADQLDRLEYTYFHINVSERKYIDGEELKDSWKNAVQKFVQDVNRTLQTATIQLVTFFLQVIQWVLYLFITLVIVKYCWRWGKKVWKA